MESLVKKEICLSADAQLEISQESRGFVKLGHCYKHFVKKQGKKVLQGKILEFFLLDALKTTF